MAELSYADLSKEVQQSLRNVGIVPITVTRIATLNNNYLIYVSHGVLTKRDMLYLVREPTFLYTSVATVGKPMLVLVFNKV